MWLLVRVLCSGCRADRECCQKVGGRGLVIGVVEVEPGVWLLVMVVVVGVEKTESVVNKWVGVGS